MYYSKKEYRKMTKVKPSIVEIFKNAFSSFLGGGIICLIGQIIFSIFNRGFDRSNEDSIALTIGVMILVSALLSAFGIYDKIGQYFKCGSIIPITGFANSTVSAAMEYKPEGMILGVGANALKLSGTVIALGIGSAYIVALIRYVVHLI